MDKLKTKPDIFLDTQSLCRLCLSRDGKPLQKLLDEKGVNNKLLLMKIYECTTLKISLETNFPSAICAICSSKLEEYYKFRQQCINNDLILHSIVQNQLMLNQERNLMYENGLKSLQMQLYGSADETTLSQGEFVPSQQESEAITMDLSKPTPPRLRTKIETIRKYRPHLGPKYECTICIRKFRNSYTLRRHMNLHTEENLFHCEYCAKKFNDRSNLKIHLRAHTGNNLYRCEVCFKMFISPSTLKYHLRAHRKMKSFQCKVCFEIFDEYRGLEEHIKTKHGDVKTERMPHQMDEEFMAADFVKIEIDAEEDDYHSNNFVKLEPVDEDDIPEQESEADNEEATFPQQLIDAVESPPSMILFRCDYCMQIFEYLDDLNIHMDEHKNEPAFKCEKCSKTFRTEDLLKVHKDTHADDEKLINNRKCKICKTSFKCELNLEAHMEKHRVKNQLESLDNATYSQPETSTSQSDEEKTQIKKKCEICAETFDTQTTLEQHVATHFEKNEAVSFVPSTDRPYKCTECHKSFKRKDYLLIHIRTHTGERRYRCDMCSSAFVHPSNLITHRKLHSTERPFKCDVCSSAFKLYAGLKIHRKRCVSKYYRYSVDRRV